MNLKPWDGTCRGCKLDDMTIAEGLLISEAGDVYYTMYTGEVCIWATAGQLYNHIRHLNQLFYLQQQEAKRPRTPIHT